MQRSTVCLLAGSVVGLTLWGCLPACGGETLRLESPSLGLRFDGSSGTLCAVNNKLTGETYSVARDQFSVETTNFRAEFRDVKLVSLRQAADRVAAVYSHDRLGIEVAYTLGPKQHFAEKRITLTFKEPCGFKRVVIGEPTFSGAGLRTVPYRYPKFMRKPGMEPSARISAAPRKADFSPASR